MPLAFRSTSPFDERYVWHPRVHERYQEQCHFILLAGEDPSRSSTFTSALRDLLALLDIASATIHALYGPYDALVRFWATPGARKRFLVGLDDSGLEIYSTREFTAGAVAYSTVDLQPTLDEIEQHINKVEEIVLADYRGVPDTIPHHYYTELERLGILVRVPPAPGAKFYLFLSEEANRQTQPADFVVRELMSSATAMGLKGLSIYTGVGFCNFVVKGIVPSYDEALVTINGLRRASKDLRLAPWSLVVADHANADVGETIDAVLSGLSLELENFLRVATDIDTERRQLRREVTSLNRDERAALEGLIANARREMRPEETERYFEVISAVILKDRKRLNKSLSFLTSIEGDLRFVLPRLLSRALGEQWWQQLQKTLQNAGEATEPPPEEEGTGAVAPPRSKRIADWSLFSLFYALSVAESQYPERVAPLLKDRLPVGWNRRFRQVVSLRNDFAHSTIHGLVREGAVSGALGDTLENVAFSLSLQARLETFAEEYGTGIDSNYLF